jgi:3-oxoacyl-[acyl-carrier-protein] synthase II
MAVGGYQLLDNLTSSLPRPFSPARDGFLLGEGGALFVLEPPGRRARAALLGVGSSHDAAHPTRPRDDGGGLIRALRAALAEAGLAPEQIDYVNAHSPGTFANDRGEAAAYRAVFGAGAVPVSSTKAALGHAQGGANALEAAACLLALERQAIPPTLHVDAPDPAFALDLVVGGPRPARLAHVLSTAESMGGANAVVILGPPCA